jgi:hypothetical protein
MSDSSYYQCLSSCVFVFLKKFLNIIRDPLERKLNNELRQHTAIEKTDTAPRHLQWIQHRLSISSDPQRLTVGFAALILSDFIPYKWFTNDTKTE